MLDTLVLCIFLPDIRKVQLVRVCKKKKKTLQSVNTSYLNRCYRLYLVGQHRYLNSDHKSRRLLEE